LGSFPYLSLQAEIAPRVGEAEAESDQVEDPITRLTTLQIDYGVQAAIQPEKVPVMEVEVDQV
jgi:hypothetical protein